MVEFGKPQQLQYERDGVNISSSFSSIKKDSFIGIAE
jgi:hypothetical protein